MKKLIVLVALFLLVACGGQSTKDRLIGKWSGTAQQADGGDTVTMNWEFLEDGQVVITVLPGVLDVVETGTWRIDENDNICTMIGDSTDEGGCSSVEFIGDDTVEITGNTNGTVWTMTRNDE